MKTLRKVNTIAFYTTLVLFLTLYLGMLAEIPLGIIQVISALILTFNIKNKSAEATRQLAFYWILVAFELILFICDEYFFRYPGDFVNFTLIVFLPMGIAIYFFIIMRKITNEFEIYNQKP